MRVLIVGIDSTIGSALATRMREAGHEVMGTSRRPGVYTDRLFFLDLADHTLPLYLSDAMLRGIHFDVCFICAGITSFHGCTDPRAYQVNAVAPRLIARHIYAQGGRIVLLSSSAVFDGLKPNRTGSDRPNPTSQLGMQKMMAEAGVAEEAPDRWAVLRLSKVLWHSHPLIVRWLTDLQNGREVQAHARHWMAPVALDDVTDALQGIAETGDVGGYMMSGPEDVAYWEAARHIAARLDAHERLVNIPSADALGIPEAHRPRHSTMDSSRVEEMLGRKLPGAYEVLDRVFGLRSDG